MLGRGKLWQISHPKLWRIPACLLSLFMSQNIVKIWMVKFGEQSVIHQIHQSRPSRQSIPPPKICAIWYLHH